MTNLDDASSPQLKAAKKWLDAYSSRDTSKLGPLLSKHFKHQTFPKSIFPEETKEKHLERYGKMVAPMTTYEVRMHTAENCLRARRLIFIIPSSSLLK
jgi:hypothetical protein